MGSGLSRKVAVQRKNETELGILPSISKVGKIDTKEIIKQKLEQVKVQNLEDVIDDRRSCGCLDKYLSFLGNTVLYLGTGASTCASAMQLLGYPNLSNTLLFSSTACFGLSVALLGCAKFGKSKAEQRELQFKKIEEDVKKNEEQEAKKTEGVKQIDKEAIKEIGSKLQPASKKKISSKPLSIAGSRVLTDKKISQRSYQKQQSRQELEYAPEYEQEQRQSVFFEQTLKREKNKDQNNSKTQVFEMLN